MRKFSILKIFAAVVLCVCLITALCPAVNASGCELILSEGSNYAGMKTTVTLSVKNNPGISNGIIFIEYDTDYLSADKSEVTVGNVGSEFEITEITQSRGMLTIGFIGTENVTDDGVLFNLPFTVNLNAKKTKTKISVEVKELVGTDDIPIGSENEPAIFEIVSPPSFILGDVNKDNTVNITDAMMLFYHVAKKEFLTNDRLVIANMDENETVDINDAMILFKKIAKSE